MGRVSGYNITRMKNQFAFFDLHFGDFHFSICIFPLAFFDLQVGKIIF
jgi:hypothetical protein